MKIIIGLITILLLISITNAQTITVTSPNGGENWTVGDYHPIHWDWTGSISAVKLEYSTDGGGIWNVITSSTSNDGNYAWVIPNSPSSNCVVKVTSTTNSNIYDISNSNFTIARPVITVLSPNGGSGGEIWTVGDYHAIHWDWTGDFSSVRLEYSTDGGSNWYVISASTSNDGNWSWVIPNTPSMTCRVKVTNTSDPDCFDVSDQDFIIIKPTITVTRPNGGEVYYVGKYHPIHWDWTGDFSSVKIEYSTNSGSTWSVITSSTSNDGSYSWIIPNTPSASCKVKVTNTSDPNSYDISDADFTISSTPPTNSIFVTSPRSGDNWIVGKSYYITWTWTGSFNYVNIEYSTNGGATWDLVNASAGNYGYHSWTIPNTPSSNCKVRISNALNPSVYDESDIFTIAPQTIMVTSPRSGDNWIVGRSYYMTWTWTGSFNYVKIEYSTNGGSTWDLVNASAGNFGYYSWTIPNTPSSNCKVRISNAANPSVYDESDIFTIAPQTITVTSPRLGDSWIVGRSYYMTWTWTSNFNYVKIEYSTNGGSTWDLVSAGAGNFGYYLWTIPNTPSSNCKVRITNTADNSVPGISNTFTIQPSSAIEENVTYNLPLSFSLSALYPNPFRTSAKISYYLSGETEVNLTVFNTSGRVVSTLVNEKQKPGHYNVTWDINSVAHSKLPNGVYFYRLKAGEFTATKKMVILR